MSPLQALSGAREPLSNKEHPAKRRKIDDVTRADEKAPDQDVIDVPNSDGCGFQNGDVIPLRTQISGSAGTNLIRLDTSKASKQSSSKESFLNPQFVSKVGSPSPRPIIKRDASHSQPDHRAPDPRTEELKVRAAKDSLLMHLMKDVGAGRASEAQLEEFRQYVVTLGGSADPQAKTSSPASPKAVSGATSEARVEVGIEPSDSNHHKDDQSMPFQETRASQRSFIDPQTNELSPPYSPLPARQCDKGIPGQADAAIQVDLRPEMCDQGPNQSIAVEPTRIIEQSNDTQEEANRRLSLDPPLVLLATCSKCKKRVFSGISKAMGIVLW